MRKAASMLKFRPFYLTEAKKRLAAMSPKELQDLSTFLDASKRSKIIGDVVRHFQDQWLESIRVNFFSENEDAWNQFREDYKEKPYSRNVVGSLNELVSHT